MKQGSKYAERSLAWLTLFAGLKFATLGEWVWAAMLLICVVTYAVTEFYLWYSMRRFRAHVHKVAERQSRDQ